MIEGIYNVSYSIWNNLMALALTLFTTSPTAANGSVYATTHGLYLSISNISTPIAICFFLIAIIRDVIQTPADQQSRKFFGDTIKFGLMIAIVVNLWEIMGYIIQITDGVTSALSVATSYQLTMSADLQAVINEAAQKPDVSVTIFGFTDDLKVLMGAWFDYIMTNFLFFMIAMGTLVIIVASAISILSSAFQRIIKPLAILPFASITVAMGAGGHESQRVMSQYLKTFFAFCISGAFMVICIKLGVALTDGLVAFDINGLSLHEKVLYISIQNAITPIVIAGLIRGADSILGRFF